MSLDELLDELVEINIDSPEDMTCPETTDKMSEEVKKEIKLRLFISMSDLEKAFVDGCSIEAGELEIDYAGEGGTTFDHWYNQIYKPYKNK